MIRRCLLVRDKSCFVQRLSVLVAQARPWDDMINQAYSAEARIDCSGNVPCRLPPFLSSLVCVLEADECSSASMYYTERKPEGTKNGGGLGTRLGLTLGERSMFYVRLAP